MRKSIDQNIKHLLDGGVRLTVITSHLHLNESCCAGEHSRWLLQKETTNLDHQRFSLIILLPAGIPFDSHKSESFFCVMHHWMNWGVSDIIESFFIIPKYKTTTKWRRHRKIIYFEYKSDARFMIKILYYSHLPTALSFVSWVLLL